MMRWNVAENDPPIMGAGWEILLDGEPVPSVVEMDTEEGYLVAMCRRDAPGHGTDKHVDPDDPFEPCIERHEGTVEAVPPEVRA